MTTFIRMHFNEELRLEELAHMACLSKYHFHRVFRETFGETVHNHIRRIRLEQSAFRLLDGGHDSITNVAYACGFPSSQHFTRTFKAYYGLTPKMVRREADLGNLVFHRIQQLHTLQKKTCRLPAEVRSDGAFITLPVNMLREKQSDSSQELNVMDMPPLRVAFLRTQTFPAPDKLSTLLTWAASQGVLTGNPMIFVSISFIPSSKGKVTYDASMTVPYGISSDADSGVRIHDLEAGQYGVYHGKFQTAGEVIEKTMDLSLGWWASGFFPPQPRPINVIYYNNPEIHPSKSWIIDICLPITTGQPPP